MSLPPLLEVDDVAVHLRSRRRASHRSNQAPILSRVDLRVGAGEIVGVVGETGSGKTTLARTVLGLVRPSSGGVRFAGEDVSRLGGRRLRDLRRTGAIQLVFQDPLRSLDPDLTVARIVGEGLDVRGGLDAKTRDEEVRHALARVGLDAAVVGRRPGELSGGQRQRVAIARAIVLKPRLLLCDEPVSALDASNRNRILRLLRDLRAELGIAIVLISHDLASIAGVVDRVAVLYRGRIVEDGPPAAVFREPAHPYTALLVASAPRISRARWQLELSPEDVSADSATSAADGACVFSGRCRFTDERCRGSEPLLASSGPDRLAACHRASEWRQVVARAATP